MSYDIFENNDSWTTLAQEAINMGDNTYEGALAMLKVAHCEDEQERALAAHAIDMHFGKMEEAPVVEKTEKVKKARKPRQLKTATPVEAGPTAEALEATRIAPGEWATRCQEVYKYYNTKLLLTVVNGEVKIMNNLTNYKIIINDLFPGLKTSDFDHQMYLGNRPLKEEDYLEIADRLCVFLKGVNVKKAEVKDAVARITSENHFNPLSEYFEKLPATTTKHLDNWLTTVCGAKDIEINRTLGRKWLVSAVARAMQPGSYAEGSLILYGSQGAGKTWLFRNLNPIIDYYCGSNVDISNIQKACQTYQGKFIIEFGELSSITKANLEDTKQYLTETHDTYVPKYSNLPITIPRQMIFGGSTNNPDILQDSTGNRRFWCVEIGEVINQEFFLSIKEELWAEAYQAFMAGEEWTLTPEEREILNQSNSKFEVDNPLQDYLFQELQSYADECFTSAKLKEIADKFQKNVHPRAIAKVMTALGYIKRKITTGPNRDMNGYYKQ